MRRLVFLPVMILFLAEAAYGQANIEIALKQGSQAEAQTKAQLQRLLTTYDLSPWIYTKWIVIDEKSIPHSHPILTLHTRHLKDDDLLLSTFVHEQFHWFLVQREKDTEAAKKELRERFPKVPVGFPEGATDEDSTYLHVLVCYLEQQANLRLLGELKTKQVMDFWATDHYTWDYKTVVERSREIGALMRKHQLIPAR